MTKEQASDLKSLTDRLVVCELEHQRATFALDEAKAKLANFVHFLQYPKVTA
mgnify:FL=1